MWFQELSSCSCFTVLHGLTWLLLNNSVAAHLDAHAEREWECGDDEEDRDEGEQQGAAAGALGVR